MDRMHHEHEKIKSHFFHSNLISYVLVKRDLHNENNASLLCVDQTGEDGSKEEGIVAFLSPIDAYIESVSLNQYSNEWEVQPFHQVDPREFILTHNYKLIVYLIYGMAGYNGKLVSRNGESKKYPKPLFSHYQFNVPKEAVEQECFTVMYKDLDLINDIYDKSGIYNYYGILLDVAEWSESMKLESAQEALRLSKMISEESGFNQTALYDPINKKWAFVDFKVSLN